jgi:ABC-type multidrug transport system permease subunit
MPRRSSTLLFSEISWSILLVFFYALSYLVPATYFINITRGVILRGAGIAHLWSDDLALFTMDTVLLILAPEAARVSQPLPSSRRRRLLAGGNSD